MLKRLDPEAEACLPLQQDVRFRRALERLDVAARVEPLAAAGSTLVITRKFGPAALRFTSRGPVWTSGTALDERIAALRQARLRIINAEDPEDATTLRAAGYRQIVSAAHVAEWPISTDGAALWGAARGKWRNRARFAARSGLVCSMVPFDPARHGWLVSAEAAQRRVRRYRTWPLTVTLAYAERHPGDVWVCESTGADGAPCAGMLFLRHGRIATYHLGWTSAAGRAHSAHHLMLMTAGEALARMGVGLVDLGTVDTEDAPGLARFKIGCGARVRPLGGTWLKIPGL